MKNKLHIALITLLFLNIVIAKANTGAIPTLTKTSYLLNSFLTNPPTGNASQTFCAGATLANIQVTGTTIKWYATATGGSVLPNTTLLLNNSNYYASQTIAGVESTTRLHVIVTINSLPIVSVNNPTVCQGQLATVTATATTSAPYSFVWSVPVTVPNPGNAASFTTGIAGIYSVIVTNTVTGCVSTSTSGTVTLLTAPTISVPTSYQVCDDNNDGVSCMFILSTKDSEISTQAGLTITYHLTPTSAQTGANPIPNNTPYCNITNPQTIYARVYNPLAPNCVSTTSFQLIVNQKPVANLPVAYHLCDDNTDGIQTFNLTAVVTPQVLGATLPAANYAITYFTSLADAQAGDFSAYIPPNAFVTASATIWIRVQNNATGCSDIITESLVVDPLPTTLLFFPQYELCENSAPVCVETFDLTSKITTILQGQTGMQVTFYPTLADAVNNTNPITNPSAYTNVIPCAQTIGIRITNVATGCYVTSTMDLVVNPKPQPIPPTGAYTVCGTDQTGLTCIDLTTNVTPGILSQSPGVYTISYHLTASDATNNLNTVNANWFCNDTPFSQFLWVRAENPITHCFSIMPIEINVDPAPVMPTNLVAIANCDVDSNTQDGCTTFNLEVQTPIILAAQALPASNYTVTYYTTQTAASSAPAVLSIFNTTSYTACATSTVWVRIENIVTHCFSVGSFQLQVNTPIMLTTPTFYYKCDSDAVINDQYSIFNMVAFVGNVPGHTLEFFFDANHTLPLAPLYDPSAFQNTIAGHQTVFVVATNTATGCKSFTTLTIDVLPIPTPNTNLSTLPLIKCDDVNPSDGYEIFDLTTNAAYIMNNDVNVSLHYFPSQLDAINNTAEIMLPTAANVHQNVWIRVESLYNIDTQTPPQHCYVLVEQPIIVNPLPLIVSGHVYQECDDDTDGFTVFNLNSQAGALLAGNALPLTNYTLAFYLDAALTQPIPSTFTNTNTTGNTQTIYVVATNTVTGCKSPVSQFTIMVSQKPILSISTIQPSCGIPLGHIEVISPIGSQYEYSIDGQNYQTSTIFLGVSTGIHNILCHLVQSSCFSDPVSVTINFVPNVVITGINQICSGESTNLYFSGTPNAVVIFAEYNGSNQTITLDGSGHALYATPILTSSTSYNLISVVLGSFTCNQNLGNPINIYVTNCMPNSGFHLNAFLDTNNNGIQDSGEINFPLGQFHYQVNNTNHNIFSFSGTYDITENNPNVMYYFGYTINSLLSNYFTVNPASYSNMHINSAGGIINVNFAVSLNIFSDLAIHNIPLNSPVPGFNYQHLLLYSNNGLLSASGSINFLKDYAVSMVGVSEPSAVINANGFTYNFTNLQPFQNRSIIATMHVPALPNVNFGQLLVSSASINSNSGTDMVPSNNNSSSYQFVVGSYDPNDIVESHGKEILHSSFTSEDYLFYTIRFENTGIANAIEIRIDNLLDSQLDESTLEMVGSSHNYVMDRVGNAANWKFNNIQLPPSVADSNIGKGYVMYKIKPKAGYAVGDIIPNSASIYFDTNPAIVTNTFLTEFVGQLINGQFSSISFKVYPNPAKEQITVQMSANAFVKQIKIIDMLGRIIKTESYSSLNSMEIINLKEVANGSYFVEVTSDSNQKEVKKIIVNQN